MLLFSSKYSFGLWNWSFVIFPSFWTTQSSMGVDLCQWKLSKSSWGKISAYVGIFDWIFGAPKGKGNIVATSRPLKTGFLAIICWGSSHWALIVVPWGMEAILMIVGPRIGSATLTLKLSPVNGPKSGVRMNKPCSKWIPLRSSSGRSGFPILSLPMFVTTWV